MNITVKKSTFALILAGLLALPLMALAAPENVKGLSATVESTTSIKLNWEGPSPDAEQPTGYRVYYNSDADGGSVQNGETFAYINDLDTENANPTYTLTGLEPDTMYYIAVTALNAENEESEAYSLEAQGKTQAGEAQQEEENVENNEEEEQEENSDNLAPMVLKVMAQDNTHVLVGFSERIVLPASNPESAFTITEQINTNNALAVQSAQMYSDDATGKTVLLETDAQIKNTNYVVTTGVSVKDQAGNPIISGASDSGLFVGTDTPQEDENTNEETSSNQVDCGTHYVNDPGKNTEGAKECFEVSFETCTPATYTKVSVNNGQETEYEYKIEESGTGLCSVKTTYLKNEANPTWENKNMTCEYNNNKNLDLAETEVLNSFNSSTKLGNCSGDLFTILTAENENENTENTNEANNASTNDAPEEVANLRLTFEQMADSMLYMIGLDWTASSAGDLFDQILYMSTDSGANYDAGKSLGKDLTNYNVNDLEGGQEYTFKLVTKDADGNLSDGIVKSLTLPDVLPESGAGMGLLLVGSGLAARRMLRRRKQK